MNTSSVQLRHIALALGLVFGAAGCSTISDLDPTGLLSDSSSSDNAPASQFPDQTAPTASDQQAGTTPDLASLPARPAPAATPGDQQQMAQSLATDGAQARYSADALRGGTEAAAPPPAASDSAPSTAQRVLGGTDTPPTASDTPPTASETPPTAAPAPQVAAAAPPPAAQPAAAPPPEAPVAAEPPPQIPAGAQPAVPMAAPVQTAALPNTSVATPVGPSASVPAAPATPALAAAPAPATPRGEPAVPANTPMRGASAMMAQPAASDAALGFKPSAAPPLDPSVGQFVSAPIVARYRQTAANSVTVNTGAIAAVPASSARGSASSDDGSVVANLDSVASGRIAMMNGGVAPTAVIFFAGDGVKLNKAAHTQIRAAVAAFKASGGRATIRVVGHASSRTANMSVEKHMETIFAKSQARASAVAQDLIHQGVPAEKVLVDAVGDSQPVYFESMPKGEQGNRRAEIFVQG